MRRGACGLADLLDFEEEEGGSFSFISSKSARPCSARPEQTRRVACLQGCFFAELAHTRPATTSREPVEPPRADSEHPPKVALATASREPLEPPRAGSEHPPKVALAADAGESSAAGLPRKTTPPTLASRATVGPPGKTTAAPVEPPRAGPEAFPPALALTHPQSAGRSVGEAATAGRRTKRCLCREGCLCVAFFRCAKLCASQRQSSWAVALPAPEAPIAFRHIRRDTYWQPTAGPRKKCADLCPVATCLWGQILRWQCSAYS